jgi:hypothetical protein
MALTTGTVHTVNTIQSDAVSPVQVAQVLFTISGTYDTSLNSSLVGVPTLIQNSRRNGKTVTMVGAMVGNTASKASAPGTIMSLKTVAISSADVTFELTDGDHTTEMTGIAIPAQARPFALLIAFVET